ncbi:unnamed protein product [Ilex paraguariensis]|uniref:Carboxypeptidase n=1 Tax=Ilex paraguariensis TaxID=185542 RepID=A0ABC8TM23_9AQUA
MESKACWVLFFSLLHLSFVADSYGKTQSEALGHLYKAKMMKNCTIDKSHFKPIDHHVHGAKVLLPQEGLKERDRIERLPGQPQVGFTQYGGYITVNQSAGRAFYYYFAEAHHSKQSLPLLLWLNGGPGCSSLAYGAMQELGPFRVHSDGKTLYQNKFAWNHAANVLFLESPAGVGFSYSNTTSDFTNGGDRKTASDNYVFLVNWLERFPEYKNRDFYISGESYAGHYVPQLAHTILYHNKEANKTIINLKGIIIGNAVINDEADNKGMYDYFASHALISDETSYQIQKYCDFSPKATTESDECNNASNAADIDVSDINIYNIYAPLCFNTNLSIKPKKASIGNAVINDETDNKGMYDYFASHALISDETSYQIQKYCDFSPKATTESDECNNASNAADIDVSDINIYNIYAPLCFNTNLSIKPKKASVRNFDPCTDYYVYAYLNRPDVQEALHANVTKIHYDWEPCSDVIKKWEDSPSTMIPLLEEFMENCLRVWIFSGDIDGRIPVTSTKYSINYMKLPVKTPWHPWLLNGEVGGYTQVYEGDLTFATVRGAGHQVPSYQPARALSLILHFLAGTPLPNTSTN